MKFNCFAINVFLNDMLTPILQRGIIDKFILIKEVLSRTSLQVYHEVINKVTI